MNRPTLTLPTGTPKPERIAPEYLKLFAAPPEPNKLHLPTITDAARELKVSHLKLFALLRRNQILGSKNIALPAYVREGFFFIDQRKFRKAGTNVYEWYAITTVMPAGMSLMQELIDEEIKAGRLPKRDQK